jgi:hypothetical protein
MFRLQSLRAGALTALAASFLLTLGACKKKEAAPGDQSSASAAPSAAAPIPPPQLPLAVASVEMGKSINADKKVSNATTTFSPRDTIYAVVNTTGGGSATVQAKWSFVKADGGETPVNESSMSISPTGPMATEFHITKASPWPKGKYKVEVFLNGTSAGATNFEVQ